jgi:uncharacterized protein
MLSLIVRTIVFIIAISAIRSFVFYLRRLWNGNQIPRSGFRPPPQQPQAGSTTLLQDPVCGTYVSIESSLKKLVRGQVIHFCSPECRNRYNA